MNVYILFAHPSPDAYSRRVLEEFVRGLRDAGHTWEIGDLYAMGFQSEMDDAQYRREVGPDPDAPVPDDVRAEQAKVEWADALVVHLPAVVERLPGQAQGLVRPGVDHGLCLLLRFCPVTATPGSGSRRPW